MALAVSSLVRRNMKHVPQYVAADAVSIDKPFSLDLEPGEELVGWYRNPPPYEDSVIVFTSTSIVSLERDMAVRIRLADIVDYQTPDSKTDADGVRIRTVDGIRFVRMVGHHGPSGMHSDVFCLVPILHSVIRAGSGRGA